MFNAPYEHPSRQEKLESVRMNILLKMLSSDQNPYVTKDTQTMIADMEEMAQAVLKREDASE